MGHVGCVFAGCLSDAGHSVIGVDVDAETVGTVNDGRSPVKEPGLGELVERNVATGQLAATTDPAAAVPRSDLVFLCVPTPLDGDRLDDGALYEAVNAVGSAVGDGDGPTVVVRSTVPPGATRELRRHFRQRTGRNDVQFAVNPEFLREGTALSDFHDPPYVVLGSFEDDGVSRLRRLYGSLDVDGDVEVVGPELAELLKMTNNVFHALKICFANEVGSLASRVGVDGNRLMELVRADRKLNVAEAYLESGFAFGGACLPKDSRAFAALGDGVDISTPLLSNVTRSNDQHLERVADAVTDADGGVVGVVGVSFKQGTFDTRRSPALRLAGRLDRETVLYTSQLLAADPGDDRFGEVDAPVLTDPDAFLERADVVVFANAGDHSELLPDVLAKTVVDPVGAVAGHASDVAEYRPVVW